MFIAFRRLSVLPAGMLSLRESAMGGTVAEAEAAPGAYLRHVASGRRVAAQGIGSIYVSHLFPFIMGRL